jgi:hypothetical protein
MTRGAVVNDAGTEGKPTASRTDELVAEMEREFGALRDFLPLVSGIEDELARHYSEDASWRVIAALKRHVAKRAYLRAILRYQQRFDLTGEPKGEVTEEERLHARDQLKALEAAGEPDDEAADPLGRITEGYRLLLCKQVAHRFGQEGARQSRAYLDDVHAEKALEKAGIRLLDCGSLEEWLRALANLAE